MHHKENTTREFNALSALVRASFFNRALFQDVALRWKGIGLWYLILLLTITWLAVLIEPTVKMSRFIKEEAPAALKDFPAITLKGGRVSSPVAQPYIMKDDRGTPMFVLDTTGATTRPSDVGAKLLLTETQLVQEESPGAIKSTPLATFPDMTVDATAIISWLKIARNLLIPVGLLVMLALSGVYRLVCMLLIAAIGLAIASSQRVRLSYAALLRLAAVGLTAPLLLETAYWFLPANLGCFATILGQLLIFALGIAYVAYGVKVAADLTGQTRHFPVQPAFPGAPDVSPPTLPREPDSPFP